MYQWWYSYWNISAGPNFLETHLEVFAEPLFVCVSVLEKRFHGMAWSFTFQKMIPSSSTLVCSHNCGRCQCADLNQLLCCCLSFYFKCGSQWQIDMLQLSRESAVSELNKLAAVHWQKNPLIHVLVIYCEDSTNLSWS